METTGCPGEKEVLKEVPGLGVCNILTDWREIRRDRGESDLEQRDLRAACRHRIIDQEKEEKEDCTNKWHHPASTPF